MAHAAVGRLVLLYLPTDSPWLSSTAMLRRHSRREVSHGERFTTMVALLAAATDFFTRHSREPATILSVIGSKAAIFV